MVSTADKCTNDFNNYQNCQHFAHWNQQSTKYSLTKCISVNNKCTKLVNSWSKYFNNVVWRQNIISYRLLVILVTIGTVFCVCLFNCRIMLFQFSTFFYLLFSKVPNIFINFYLILTLCWINQYCSQFFNNSSENFNSESKLFNETFLSVDFNKAHMTATKTNWKQHMTKTDSQCLKYSQ